MTTFQTPRAGERMIRVEEAQQRVLDEIALLGTENVAFTEALGRILREDIVSPGDVPQADGRSPGFHTLEHPCSSSLRSRMASGFGGRARESAHAVA